MTGRRRSFETLLSVAKGAAIAGLALMLVSCDALRKQGVPVSGVFPVGDNLVGESCRAEAGAGDLRLVVAGLQGRTYRVFCGDWKQPSATILALDSSTISPDLLLTQGGWRSRLDLLAVCEDPVDSAIIDGVSARVLDCRLRDGGWPYSAFAATVGETLYLAQGIPAAQPVAEEAIGVLAGKRTAGAAKSAGSSDAVARLEEQLAGRFFGTGDLQDYQLLYKVGGYYNGQKSFSEAEKYYRQALEIHQRILGAQDPEFADPLMHLAVEVSNQERFTVADELFEQAGILIGRTADQADRARYISYLALHHANQRNYERALAFARQATVMRKEIAASVGGLDADTGQTDVFSQAVGNLGASSVVLQSPSNIAALDLAQSLGTEAIMLLRTDRAEEAQGVVNEALGIVEASVHTPLFWRPQILELSAQVNSKLDRLDIAEQQLRGALAQRKSMGPETRTVALSEFALGNIMALKGDREGATAAYGRAIAVFRARGQTLRPRQVMPYLDLLWDARQTGSGAAGDIARVMFDAAQLVQGAVAAQNISEAAARLSASDREVGDIIRQLQDAQRERDSLMFQFNAAASRAVTLEDRRALDEMRTRVRELEEMIAQLEPQAQAAAPNLNLLRDNASDFAEVSGLLRSEEALVQFILGDEYGYAFLVTAGGVQVARIDVPQAILSKAVGTLREAFVVQRTAAGAEIGAFDVRLAHLLYQRLMGEFDGTLSGIRHLVTVPSGPLLSLPLGLLVTRETPAISGFDYSGVDWLIKRSAISLSPSVRAFVDLRSKAKPSSAPKKFLGLGDFVPSGDPDAILRSRGLPEACRQGAEAVAFAPRLAETSDQILAMAASFGAPPEEMVMGADFTEEAIKQLPLDQYKVLVMATHGLLPGELDCLVEPAMVVSRPGGPDDSSDGLLTYSEIFDLQLDADVVVLSACNTGGPLSQSGLAANPAASGLTTDLGESDRARGESLAGLARAFFYAGARSLLVSNWEVYTEATVKLMTETFSELQSSDDATLAISLQKAKLSFLGEPTTSHPYLWGSFSLIGDGEPPKRAPEAQSNSEAESG